MSHKILIVDDFKISNEIISHSLKEKGYETYSSQKASEAIKILNSITIDVIITDYIMPEMDGLAFLAEIRKLPGYKLTPVIFLSANKDVSVKKVAFKYNIAAWLDKPINFNDLENILNHVLKR